jgi:hypothetical protein
MHRSWAPFNKLWKLHTFLSSKIKYKDISITPESSLMSLSGQLSLHPLSSCFDIWHHTLVCLTLYFIWVELDSRYTFVPCFSHSVSWFESFCVSAHIIGLFLSIAEHHLFYCGTREGLFIYSLVFRNLMDGINMAAFNNSQQIFLPACFHLSWANP